MRIGIIIALFMVAFGVLSGRTVGTAYAADRPTIGAVRVGLHQATTRFVVETSTRPQPRISATAQPSQVVVTLPDRSFVPASRPERGSGLVRAIRYRLTDGGRGAQIVLTTSAPATVANMFVMDPSGGNPAYRLVIDLVAGTPSNGPVLAAPRQRYTTSKPVLVASAGPSASAMRRVVTPAPVPPSAKRRPIVVIDPGHGGVDPGAIGRKGENEKTVVLAIAQALKKDLLADGRYKVVMTRDSDVFIPLADRVKIARKAGASLFLSIHADTISDSSVQGAGVYTLSASASDAQAAALAAKENSADEIAGINLRDTPDEISSILIDFAQHHTQERSARLAALLVPRIGTAINMRERSHRSAGFRVLKAPDVPSALVEVGYLSNPADEAVLTSAKGRARIARALSQGIADYFGADS
jgi:N-acetylmuramoyl-L-alanine amidase